jgi:hypothetical protein
MTFLASLICCDKVIKCTVKSGVYTILEIKSGSVTGFFCFGDENPIQKAKYPPVKTLCLICRKKKNSRSVSQKCGNHPRKEHSTLSGQHSSPYS